MLEKPNWTTHHKINYQKDKMGRKSCHLRIVIKEKEIFHFFSELAYLAALHLQAVKS